MENIKKSHDDGLNEILNSKDISRRPLEERIEPEVKPEVETGKNPIKNKKPMSLWELRYRKNLAALGKTGTLTVPKDLKAKYNSKSYVLHRIT